MAAKHTPGPWEVHYSPHHFFEIFAAAASRTITNVPTHMTDGAVQEANARLIAAAPELLEALAGLRASIGRMPADMSRPGWCEIVTALFEADAAIAKAKGEV